METPSDTNPGALVPVELIRKATDIASVCKEIVSKTAMTIQQRKYVKVEGWMSIATAHGCVASARDVEKVAGGVRAVGEIRRIDNGQLIATAEGFVGEDEPQWFGGVLGAKTLPKRPDYAIRAMAQTRAISRACRTAFAHVVVMMDAGLSTTPAEEVPLEGFARDSERQVEPPRGSQSAPAVPRDDNPEHWTLPEGVRWEDQVVHFGKNKGSKLGDLEEKSLNWYATEWMPKPFKGAYTDQDRALRAALNTYMDEESGSAN